MICPNCGEDNSSNFKFCGMCGTSLAERRPLGAPSIANPSDVGRRAPGEPASRTVAGNIKAAQQAANLNAGPSFLGLNQPLTEQDEGPRDRYEPAAPRDQTIYSNTFFEPEEHNAGPRRIIVLLVLVAALAGGAWWAFFHYSKSGSASEMNSQTAAPKPEGTETAANTPGPNPNGKTSSEPSSPSPTDEASSQPAATATAPPALNPAPHPSAPAAISAKQAHVPPAVTRAEPARSQNVVHARREETRPPAKPAPRPAIAAPASDDKGDASFRKGTAYLYGQGAPQNCDEAIKNLKAASAKQNAKARSTFGTMYATGHCVPRDLPSSYSWFALALRVDPNNQILEKDLVAVWNQMTPPERQMATKMKQ